MADKENSARVTRSAAARKRPGFARPSTYLQPPSKKKRTVLGELPNLSNAAPDLNTPPPSKPTTRSRKKKEEERKVPPVEDTAETRDLTTDPNGGSDLEDAQICPHYASDIYKYLRTMEVEPKRRPLANFLETVQKDVTANMRGILVDWLVEVAAEYNLVADTLYLTISYIDRYLSSNPLDRKKLQLLGVSSMLIAAKYEEISPPHVEDFCYITDNTYSRQQVVKMEADILKFLNFEMGNPTTKTFLRRFIKAALVDNKYPDLKLEFLCNYLAELSLVDYDCVRFLPSVVASSAVFVARFTIDPKTHPWSATLQRYTGYKPSELEDCIHAIHDLQLRRRKSTLTAIIEKYEQHKFKCVSALCSPPEIPASFFEDFSS